ncbi:MAG: hypothetical protein IJ518_07805 [Clostridia bacterium]|nr:hypothetical protein [Clostridia bacterium]
MRGIMNGMVMQRNDRDVCEITVQQAVSRGSYSGAASGEVTLEPTAAGTRLTGIPVGGPYTVELDGETFTDIYVGDVWMLAGQSNMEGSGILSQADKDFIPEEDIRNYYAPGYWGPAKHDLCDTQHSVYMETWGWRNICRGERRVGPGLSFGQEMKRYIGVPQGLISAAVGGTSMTQWSPDIREKGPMESLYAAMIDRFVLNGSHVRGLFWYQGCSDSAPQDAAVFTDRMHRFIQAVREDMGQIPIVQVQIGPVHHIFRDYEDSWNSVRMQQYALTEQYPLFDTISAIDKDLDDYIHLANEAQQRIGREGAESMAHLLFPERDDLLAAPRVKHVWLDTDVDPVFRTVCVEFENLHGALQAAGRPWGFAFTTDPDRVNEDSVITVRLRGNIALVRTELSVEEMEQRYVYYGWGQTTYCNLTDAAGRAVPAFGPVKIRHETHTW